MTEGSQITEHEFEADLIAYADGTLPAERIAAVEARLAHDAEARDMVAQWRHHDNLIHTAGRAADDLPDNLAIAALERQLASKLQARRRRAIFWGPGLRQIAASVVIFAAGWGAHGLLAPASGGLGGVYPGYVSAGLLGHHAVSYLAQDAIDVALDDMDAAMDWISAQMLRKIESPKLERLGYEIESARLITQDSGPVAVFVYRSPEGEPVIVSMSPQPVTQAKQRLRVVAGQNESLAYWSDKQIGYSVVAALSPAQLTTLAAAVAD